MQANTEITLKAQTPRQGSEQHPEVHIVTQHLSASFWLGSALIYVCRTAVHVQILLPVLTVSDTHKNGSDFHLTPLLFFLYFWLAANQICLLFHPSYFLFLSCHPLCFWQRQWAALAELLFSPKGRYTLFAPRTTTKPTDRPCWEG